MSKYAFTLSLKTKVLNFLRRIFTVKPFETILAYTTQGSEPDSFIGKFVPPSYLFKGNTIRKVFRNNFYWELDLHEMIDHYIYFGHSEQPRNILYKMIKPGFTVVDIGANIGETTLMFSRLVGEPGKVIAFEPSPPTFKKLLKNISLNNINNIHAHQLALGDANKIANLYTVFEINSGMNRLLENVDISYNSSPVEVVSFDSFVEKNNSLRIDFIMMDAEGYELKVLRGAEQTIKKNKPAMFIELDNENLKEHNNSAAELVSYLNGLGYTIRHALNNHGITPNDNFDQCHYDIIAECK